MLCTKSLVSQTVGRICMDCTFALARPFTKCHASNIYSTINSDRLLAINLVPGTTLVASVRIVFYIPIDTSSFLFTLNYLEVH